jgi:cell wall-associated NlpC family hydrolase
VLGITRRACRGRNCDETNITSRDTLTTLCNGERTGGVRRANRGVLGLRGNRARACRHAGGRAALRVLLGSGLVAALSLPGAPPRWELAGQQRAEQHTSAPHGSGHPHPPTKAQINAAENRVRQQQAALGREQGKLSAASQELTKLQTQAEVLTQRYDQTLVNEQQAAAAYRVTEDRLSQAEQQRSASRRRLAALAAEEFESGGGFGPMTAMIGDAAGPQAYMRQVGLGQVLAQSGTETVAANQANDVVAGVFRAQARRLLTARQADLRAASQLKLAVQASVTRQLAFVRASQKQRNKLAGQVATARANAAALTATRQAALAAQATAAADRASAAAGSTAEGPSQAPSWAWGSGASSTQGDIAANWALTQLGKPYQWGAAGPGTYDCSGLTMVAWAHAGVSLLHYTGYQWEEGPHVPLNQLQRGDLLFFATNTADPSTIHHVGIYIGNGMMVDAPYTGAFVRIDSMYQPGGLIGAVRPAG